MKLPAVQALDRGEKWQFWTIATSNTKLYGDFPLLLDRNNALNRCSSGIQLNIPVRRNPGPNKTTHRKSF
jgi:hypothetical protein